MIKYGNYIGSNYNRYPLEPIDELDYCCFLHDIDHKQSGSNNRYADRELNKRLKKVSFKKLSFKGKLFYIGARYLYSYIYAKILRQYDIFDEYMRRNKYGKTADCELQAWANTYYERNRAYLDKAQVWNKNYNYLI